MATRLFSTLVDRITPNVPGCPQPVVINYARLAARDVCRRTLAWTYVQPDITFVDGTFSYTFTPPAETDVTKVLFAEINDASFTAAPIEVLAASYPYWPTSTAIYRGSPQHYATSTPGTFLVAPCPDGVLTYVLRMLVALVPQLSATGMEQAVLDAIEPAVIHGTLEQLLVLPERPWTSTELAAYHAKQYIHSVAAYKAEVLLGPTKTSLVVKQRPLA